MLLTRKLLSQWFLLVKLKLSLRKLHGCHHDLVNRFGISVTQITTGYVPFVVITMTFCPHSWLITWFATRLARWVPLVEQKMSTLSGAPEFTPDFVRDSYCSIYNFLCSVLQIRNCLSFFIFCGSNPKKYPQCNVQNKTDKGTTKILWLYVIIYIYLRKPWRLNWNSKFSSNGNRLMIIQRINS